MKKLILVLGMATSLGAMANNDPRDFNFTTQVNESCGFQSQNGTDHDLGIDDEYDSNGAIFRVYNNGNGINGQGQQADFDISIRTTGYNGSSDAVLDTFTMKIDGQAVLSGREWTASLGGVTDHTVNSRGTVSLKAKTSLSEHQIPANIRFGVVATVSVNCF